MPPNPEMYSQVNQKIRIPFVDKPAYKTDLCRIILIFTHLVAPQNHITMISILMPVFNTAPYLEDCLDSILEQSFEDWELIAIDDFSTDQSGHILREYAHLDPRITWFRNDQKGIVPALEKSYRHSRGNIIHRMDSDDLMPGDKLENLYHTLTESGPGSVATGMVRYFRTDQELKRGFIDYGDWINRHIATDTIFEDIFMECPIASPAWLMYQKDLERIGGITSHTYPEDYDLVFRMYVHGIKAKGVKNVVHLWRDWSDRASRTREEYADQLFFQLKLQYFIKYKYQVNKPFVIWGAGSKGKKLVRLIQETGLPFSWVTENSKKLNHVIYGKQLTTPESVISSQSQVIVAVSNPAAKLKIRRRMEALGLTNNSDLFFFC